MLAARLLVSAIGLPIALQDRHAKRRFEPGLECWCQRDAGRSGESQCCRPQ
jgi:hypothetical protein